MDSKKINYILGGIIFVLIIVIFFLFRKKCPACGSSATTSMPPLPGNTGIVPPNVVSSAKISDLQTQLASAQYKLFNMKRANVSADQIATQQNLVNSLTSQINSLQALGS